MSLDSAGQVQGVIERKIKETQHAFDSFCCGGMKASSSEVADTASMLPPEENNLKSPGDCKLYSDNHKLISSEYSLAWVCLFVCFSIVCQRLQFTFQRWVCLTTG